MIDCENANFHTKIEPSRNTLIQTYGKNLCETQENLKFNDPIVKIELERDSLQQECNNISQDLNLKFESDIKPEVNFYHHFKSEIKHEDQASQFVNDKRKQAKNKVWDLTKYQFFTGKSYGINHNEHLTTVFEELANNYTILKDKGRTMAYKYAIAKLKSYPERITV